MNGWSEQFDLARGAQRAVSIPTLPPDEAGFRLAPIDIVVRDAFVPAEIDRASTDRRALGCRIEMVP